MAALGFVGLGVMGSRMARRLLDAGHAVVGYNRSRGKAQSLVSAGLAVADTPRMAAERADVILSMVADTDALRAVAGGPDGILAGLGRGAVWLEMSTVSPAATRAIGTEAARREATLLDAPVSGSVSAVEQGQLAIYVGGDPAALERVRPLLAVLGPTVVHVGPLGAAVTMKIAINLNGAVQIVAFSEAVLLAEKAGIAREAAVQAILQSVMASGMLRYRGPFVLKMPDEAWFRVPMMQKDARLALELGRELGVPLPATGLAHELLTGARALGLDDYDCAAVFDVLAGLSGLAPSAKPSGGQ